MSKKDKAFELYKVSKGMKPLVDIANELEASPGTVRGWKSRYKWDEQLGINSTETKCSATDEKRNATRNVTKDKEVPRAVEELNANEELTEQQKVFCLYYLQSFNGTQAYIKAYKSDYDTAMVNASRLLRNAKVKTALDELKVELQLAQYFTIDDIIKEYGKQAFVNINDLVEFGVEDIPLYADDGSPAIDFETGKQQVYKKSYVRFKEQSEVDGTLIQEVKQGKDGVSLKIYDKQRALGELVKIMSADGGADGEEVVSWKEAVIAAANKRAAAEKLVNEDE